MTPGRRLRVLYLVPGHGLLSTVGPTRNVLSLARALQAYADVAVAFRYVIDERVPEGLDVLEIQPQAKPTACADDAAMRGLGMGEFVRYLRDLRGFATAAAARFDIILEKSWLLSGSLSSLVRRRGGVAIPVENVVPSPDRHEAAGLMKRLRVQVGARMAGHYLRQAPLIIAETEHLKADMVRVWGIEPERVEVVGLGVDRGRFRPSEQRGARATLGIPSDAFVLLYVGVLDEIHTLDPVIDVLVNKVLPGVELHLVGDGPKRGVYEAKAANRQGAVIFHGRVPHDLVPTYIAAADLCLAPYDPRAFATGALGYSTMKVPEYLSVGRPVVSLPSARMRELLREGETGFLFDNTVQGWERFLTNLPSRERLAAMGREAARTPLPDWDATARGYLAAGERLLRKREARG